MFTFYGLRSLRECLVELHCYKEITNIANDSHGHWPTVLISAQELFAHDICYTASLLKN